MKKLSITPSHFKMLIISILCFFQIFAQQKEDPDKKYKDELAKYDFSMLKSNVDDWQVLPFLLNDSLTFKYITKFIFETTFATQKIGCTFGFLF